MFYFKSNTENGLDQKIYNYIINKCIKFNKNFYFYTFDFVKAKKLLPPDFYSDNNTCENTWNFNLTYLSTTKKSILEDSIKFGFGNYKYTKNDDEIIVKAIGHCQTTDLYGQAHKVNKIEFENIYNKNKYIGQKLLRSSTNDFNEELNIFVVRNLETRELHFHCILCINNTTVNINRKFSKCEYKEVNIDILDGKLDLESNKLENFKKYLNFINFDFGRIELIKDINLGWCIIDVNNSPGNGPVTDMVYEKISNIFLETIQNL